MRDGDYRADIAELAKEADRLWFNAHPERRHRLRQALAGELPGVTADKLMVVRQCFRGLRLRWPFMYPGSLPPGEAPEWFAKKVFETIAHERGNIGMFEAEISAIPGILETLASGADKKRADRSFPPDSETGVTADA
jgi:hypothetical protein